MRQTTAILLAFAALGAAADESPAEAGDRAAVMKFLKDHVVGKTVVSPRTAGKRDAGRMESDYEDQTTFGNFAETPQGFRFDVTTVSKETRYELGKDGKRVLPGRDMSGVEVYRYELCERASTKRLTGTARLLTMTTKVPSREGAALLVTRVTVKDGKLSFNETLPGYLDLVASKGKYKPGSWDSKTTLSLAGGKLRMEYEVTNFDVDPDTLKRTPTKDKLPPFVAKEVEGKSGR
jgi:hypothetical protein